MSLQPHLQYIILRTIFLQRLSDVLVLFARFVASPHFLYHHGRCFSIRIIRRICGVHFLLVLIVLRLLCNFAVDCLQFVHVDVVTVIVRTGQIRVVHRWRSVLHRLLCWHWWRRRRPRNWRQVLWMLHIVGGRCVTMMATAVLGSSECRIYRIVFAYIQHW